MPYRDVMDLPVRTFWYVSGNVPRLLTDERKGLLEVTRVASQGSDESFAQYHEFIERAAPEPVKMRAEVHTAGPAPMEAQAEPGAFDILRSLAG